jgi:hypothetical protein
MSVQPGSQPEWNIRAAAAACGVCGSEFADGGPFFSRLRVVPGQGYDRGDFCPSCWNDDARRDAISVWKSVFRAPPPPPAEALKKETAESLLRHLIETGDPARREAVFVLAVMLERRRTLIEREVRMPDGGGKVRVYEHRGTGEAFVIEDPQLRLDDLERVQRLVAELLGGPAGSTAAPEAAAAPAATTDRANEPCST